MHRSARKAKKQGANLENEAREVPKAKESQLENRISKIATLDNGTMVEALKYLKYCQLGTNSLVSKRFCNVIRTHRHKLALLYVNSICLKRYIYNRDPATIEIFNKQLTPEEYDNWVVRRNYSNQISPERQAAGDHQSYELSAYGDYKYPNSERMSVFFSHVKEINHDMWPLFQHFVRLLTDPSIYIRYVKLIPHTDVFNLLSAAVDRSNCGLLQCKELEFNFERDAQKFVSWIKDHVRCVNFQIAASAANRDKQFLDFFVTGSHCASEIVVMHCYLLKGIVVGLVQKFMHLKSCDECHIVHSIRGDVIRPTADALKRNYAKYFIKKEKDQYGITLNVFEFVNVDVGKKLQLTVKNFAPDVILEIINL